MIEPLVSPLLAPLAGDPLTPEWWLARLGARLDARRWDIQRYDDYYNGVQPLAFASDKFRETFGERFHSFSSNYMALVVDAHRERLTVQGFRFGEEMEGDDDAWRWWQENNLDAESEIAHTESLVKGVVYVLVWPDEAGKPVATIEDPFEMIVETATGNRKIRRAALKRWLDDDLRLLATLYLPEAIFKFQSKAKFPNGVIPGDVWATAARGWEPRTVPGETWPLANPIGVVPVVPLLNRPRITGSGQSEIAMVMNNQDAINKYRADALVAAEYAAFRQRYIIGLDDPPVDPDTGQPLEQFKAAVSHLWRIPPPDPDVFPDSSKAPQVEVGEFEQTDLAPYKLMIDTEVQHIASISRTPYHYFLQHGGQPPSGESLRSSETGLVFKVLASQIHKGEGWEEVQRLQFRFRDDIRARITNAETLWRDPESLTESAHVDALLKLASLDVPREAIWERIPASPQEIKRWKAMLAAEPPPAPVPAIPVDTIGGSQLP